MWKKKYSPQIKFSKQNIGKLHMTEKVIYWPFHSSGWLLEVIFTKDNYEDEKQFHECVSYEHEGRPCRKIT